MSCSYFRHCTVWKIVSIWLSPSTLPLCIPLFCLFVCFQVSLLVKRFLITKAFTTKWMTLDSLYKHLHGTRWQIFLFSGIRQVRENSNSKHVVCICHKIIDEILFDFSIFWKRAILSLLFLNVDNRKLDKYL